jgi:hypothetical protein
MHTDASNSSIKSLHSFSGVGIAAPSDHDTVSRATVGTVEGGLSHRCLNARSHFPVRVSGAPSLSSSDLLSHIVPLKCRRSGQWKTEGVWRHHGSRIDVMLTPWLHVLWLVMTTHVTVRRLHSTGCKGSFVQRIMLGGRQSKIAGGKQGNVSDDGLL